MTITEKAILPTHNIENIICNRRLIAHHQQIVSISRKMVIGIEGLIRGINAETGELILPKILFDTAREERLSLDFDRTCRSIILEQFSEIHPYDREKHLFLNLDASILESSVGSGYLLNQVTEHHIDPHNIVIEISERDVVSNAALKKFTDTYRQHGFMVALDDVGTGFSNMDRILLVKPDIIKIDISLVKNIHSDFYKQGVFRSLVILANKIGALVIAEGVESEDEAVQVLRLGGHMIQGFYFSIPGETNDTSELFQNQKIEHLSKRFKDYMNLQYMQEKTRYKHCNKITRDAVKTLSGKSRDHFGDILKMIVSGCDTLECAYILDITGIQLSETVCHGEKNEGPENLIFYTAKKGTDHSMEKYYYPLVHAKRRQFATEPYISLATGNLCITVSAVFCDDKNEKCILCADFTTTEDSYNIELRGPLSSSAITETHDMMGIINQMSEAILTDSLTGAFNRRYIEERLLVDIYNSVQYHQPLSVILADVDLFKDVNDRHGHLAGDQVLKTFVTITKNWIRKDIDWIARYGGDEFLIVLVNADETIVRRVAESIRYACEEVSIQHKDTRVNFTASFGAYTAHPPNITVDELIGTADKNLYVAKNQGRNQSIAK